MSDNLSGAVNVMDGGGQTHLPTLTALLVTAFDSFKMNDFTFADWIETAASIRKGVGSI